MVQIGWEPQGHLFSLSTQLMLLLKLFVYNENLVNEIEDEELIYNDFAVKEVIHNALHHLKYGTTKEKQYHL